MQPYTLINLNPYFDVQRMKPFWNKVPKDPYVKEGFRYKAISRYKITHGKFEKCAHRPLFQSKNFNPTHGDIHRIYDEIEHEPFGIRLMTLMFMDMCNIDDEKEVLVQAQRVRTDASGLLGHPSIEGFHQDDVSHVGIMCVDRHQISGGVTQISSTKNGDSILYSGILESGNMIILDDKKVYHYTTPIHVEKGKSEGHRDVLLFGA